MIPRTRPDPVERASFPGYEGGNTVRPGNKDKCGTQDDVMAPSHGGICGRSSRALPVAVEVFAFGGYIELRS